MESLWRKGKESSFQSMRFSGEGEFMKKLAFLILILMVTGSLFSKVTFTSYVLNERIAYLIGYDQRGFYYFSDGKYLYMTTVNNPSGFPPVKRLLDLRLYKGQRIEKTFVSNGKIVLLYEPRRTLVIIDVKNPFSPKMKYYISDFGSDLTGYDIVYPGGDVLYIGNTVYRFEGKRIRKVRELDFYFGENTIFYGRYILTYTKNVYKGPKFSLLIVDISNRINPTLASFIPEVTEFFCMKDSYLFVLDGFYDLLIYDLSNPYAPRFVRKVGKGDILRYAESEYLSADLRIPRSIACSENYLLYIYNGVVRSTRFLLMIGVLVIRNPEKPVVIGSYETSIGADSVCESYAKSIGKDSFFFIEGYRYNRISFVKVELEKKVSGFKTGRICFTFGRDRGVWGIVKGVLTVSMDGVVVSYLEPGDSVCFVHKLGKRFLLSYETEYGRVERFFEVPMGGLDVLVNPHDGRIYTRYGGR